MGVRITDRDDSAAGVSSWSPAIQKSRKDLVAALYGNYIPHMNFPMRLTAAVLLMSGLISEIAAADELWEQAMLRVSPENTLRAPTLIMTNQENNRDGEMIEETVIELSWNETEGRYVIISAQEDGKDVTERELRKNRRRNNENEPFRLHQMFNPEKADGLTLHPRSLTGVIEGRTCRIYDYRFEDEWEMGSGDPKPVVEEGVMFLDLESGMPLRIISSLTETPQFISSMTYHLEAAPGPEGTWMPNVMEMEFAGRMIIHKAGGIRMEFVY